MNEQSLNKTLQKCMNEIELKGEVREGSLAANLHEHYTHIGLRKGWLKPELTTALWRQPMRVQSKNLNAVKGVVAYWSRFPQVHPKENTITVMNKCTDYEKYRKYKFLEEAAELQHTYWKKNIDWFEKERIDEAKKAFNIETFWEYHTQYSDLFEESKDKDRLVVSVVTKDILTRAELLSQRPA